MHYVIVGPTYPQRGGIAHFTTLFAKKICSAGHTVRLYSFLTGYPLLFYPGSSNLDPSTDPLKVDAIPLIHPWLPWTWIKAARWIVAERPDAVILEWWIPFWAPVLLVLASQFRHSGILTIIDCQNVLPHDRILFDRLITRIALHRADCCLVYSVKHENELLDLLPDASHLLLPFPAFGPLARRLPLPSLAKKKMGVEGPAVLFFGFVRPYKGLPVLLRSLAKVSRQFKVHLFIVGEFWENIEGYYRLIADLNLKGQVTIVDRYIPDECLADYFSAADAVMMPYLEPVQSGVLALAQAYKKPVIGSRVGGLVEGIQEGKTGLLVEPNNELALADAILRFYKQDLQKEMEPYLELFDVDKAWIEIIQAIGDLAEAHSSRAIPGKKHK